MKIALGFDKYPKPYDYIALFSEIAGIEGEILIKKDIEDDDSFHQYELQLTDCNISKRAFVEAFEKESELYSTNVFIYILSSDLKIMHSTFVSNVEIISFFTNNAKSLNIKFYGWFYPNSKGFYQIIKKRLTHGIHEYGIWKMLSADRIQGWLQAAIVLREIKDDIKNLVVTINGNNLQEQDHFYCALGEAIHGIGGYFGRNINALEDCLYSGFGVQGNFTLNWLHHKKYKEKFPVHFNYIVEAFSSQKKTLKLL